MICACRWGFQTFTGKEEKRQGVVLSLSGASFSYSLCQPFAPSSAHGPPLCLCLMPKHMEIEYYSYCRDSLSIFSDVSYDYKTVQKLLKWRNHFHSETKICVTSSGEWFVKLALM